jgi:hypothetical protein
MSRRAHIVRTAIALCTLVACGSDYDRTELTGTIPDDLGGGISLTRLQVHEGMILKSHIVAWNDDRKPMALTVRSRDTNIVQVASVISDRDFAFVGRNAGHTQIELIADDTLVLTIEADVTPQPELPR